MEFVPGQLYQAKYNFRYIFGTERRYKEGECFLLLWSEVYPTELRNFDVFCFLDPHGKRVEINTNQERLLNFLEKVAG